MTTLICYDELNGIERHFACANGFVSRVVSAIANSDNMGCYADAQRVAEILNAAAQTEAERQYRRDEAAADRRNDYRVSA